MVTGLAGVPLIWLVSLEAAYALSYAPCLGGGHWPAWVAALAPVGAYALIALWLRPLRHDSKDDDRTWWAAWAARAGLLLCAFFAIVTVATALPIVALSPCRP